MLIQVPTTAVANDSTNQVASSSTTTVAMNEEAAGSGDTIKSGIVGCRAHGAELIKCSSNGCPQEVHQVCHEVLLLQKDGIDVLPVAYAVYTKNYYTAIEKGLATTANAEKDNNDRKGN